VIDRGIEGFDGGVYGHLDADEDSYSEGDAYDGKKGSSFMVSKMAQGDRFEEVKQDHKKIQMESKNGILKRVQSDIVVMPNLFRPLIWALDLIWTSNFDI
jgi:hypothetical protein